MFQVPPQHPRTLLLQVGLGPLHVDRFGLPLQLGVHGCWVQSHPGWDFFVELDEVATVVGVPPERCLALVVPELTAKPALKGVRPCSLPRPTGRRSAGVFGALPPTQPDSKKGLWNLRL